ncbi:hypothetical protein OIY81_2136 [Cryptosporidium canis]|nr:hypothetical protein OIY81_2136 [Cryptosporidium canis]
MNVWSLKRFSSATGSNVTSCSNSIGYFAYSLNSKIIIFDVNSMIDGSNGNIMLRSNSFNRVIIDIQNEIKTIRPWNDLSFNSFQDPSKSPEISFNVRIKSVFVNDLHWGPYFPGRWSLLFSSLNNGLIHLWLIPNIDSYSLASYSPVPCFELVDLLHSSLTDPKGNRVTEFDWETMMTVHGKFSQAFCSEFMLNTSTPMMNSPVLSVQETEAAAQCDGMFLLSACWNGFIAIYEVSIHQDPFGSCKETLSRIISPEQDDLSAFLPILARTSCRPLILTQIPNKKPGEIVTSCLITDFRPSGGELLFQVYIGSSEGKIHLLRFSLAQESGKIKCLKQDLIHKSHPSIPITQLSYAPISNNGAREEELLLALEGTKIFLGRINTTNMTCEILKPNDPSLNNIHQMPIKSVKFMEDVIHKELVEISCLTVDQSGLGALHTVNLATNSFQSFQVLTMNRLSTAPSVFPNLDQNLDSTRSDLEGSSQNSNKSFSLESLQNVPSSVQSIKNLNNDFKLISFEDPLVPGQFHNFSRRSPHNFSVAVINSATLNTIRLIIVFNNFSPMDHICSRIASHFANMESQIRAYSDLSDSKCLEKLSRAISQAFTLNDIRLVLAGPLTMNRIPILDETEEKPSKSAQETDQPKDAQVSSGSLDLKNSSFLNFKLGKQLGLRAERDKVPQMDDNSDEVLDVFLSVFYETIDSELIKEAISYNSIDDEFPDDYFSFLQISKPVFSNLILLIFCYIVEIEPFIPKSLEYGIVCTDKNSNFETLSKILNQAVSITDPLVNQPGNQSSSKNDLLSLLFKMLYSIRILNSLRCLVVLLYSRSTETVDPLVIKREELISGYINKLQYYIQLQISQIYNVEALGLQPGLGDSNGIKYIWSRIKNSEPIDLSQICESDQQLREYFSELVGNSCSLISEPPYNIYKCSHNHQELIYLNSQENFDPASSSSPEESRIHSVPICPITLLPVNVFATQKHLSCNSCGRVLFIPTEIAGQTNLESGECRSPQLSVFEKICLQRGYYTCQFCLNITELLEI